MKRNLLYNIESSGGGGTVTAPSPSRGGTIKQVRVDTAKPPPADVLKQEFSIDNFDVEQLPTQIVKTEDKTGKETIVPTKKETVKDENDNLPEDTAVPPEEGGAKKDEQKPADAPKPPPSILKPPTTSKAKEEKSAEGKEKVAPITVPTKGTQRDYSGFSTEEASLLKQMSNDGFDFATRLMKENKDLKKETGSVYYQHEQAYVLDPDYQTAVKSYQQADFESNHWLQQLVAAEKGEEVRDLQGYDAKTGKPVYGPGFKADARTVELMRDNLNNCKQGGRQAQQKMSEIPTKYQQRINEGLQGIDSECKRRFEWESKPEMMDYTFPVEYEDGVKDVSIKDYRQGFMNLFPSYMRNHPGVRVAANLAVALRIGHAEMSQLKGQQQVQQIKQDERGKVEPSSEVRPQKQSVKAVHGVAEFSDLKL